MATQLNDLIPTNENNFNWLKPKLVDIAEWYVRTPIQQKSIVSERHLQELNDLKDKNVLLVKPDKGTGAIVMDKADVCNSQ